MPHFLRYLRYECKQQDDCRPNEESSTINNSKGILKILQSDWRHKDDSQHYTTDIDGCNDERGVVQSFDVHLSGWESEDQCYYLNEGLEAIEYTGGDVALRRVADEDKVISYDPKWL